MPTTTTRATTTSLILARGFSCDNSTGVSLHQDAAAIGEVHVVNGRTILILQTGVVYRIPWARGQRRLFSLLLSHLGGDRTRTRAPFSR
jgi:hypothetical protein